MNAIGVAHCDLKPTNIVRVKSDFKIIDLGSANYIVNLEEKT